MQIKFLAFGQVATITGNSFELNESVADTDSLKSVLHYQYPALNEIKYALAVDKKLVNENMELNENVTVALLPPFSGG